MIKQEFKDFKNLKDKCPLLNDHFATSALSRMKTKYCKQMLISRLCSIDKFGENWPSLEIENGCKEYFDILFLILLDFGTHFNFSSLNSPEFCVQNCLKAGFSFAGVGFSVFCYCSNYLSNKIENVLNNSFCNLFKCPGNKDVFCGGNGTIFIYKTGVKIKNKDFNKQSKKLPKFIPFNSTHKSINKIRILFLLQLNGRNYRQIRRLLRMIYNSKHFYFIHVDSRQEFMQLEMIKIQKTFESKVLKERFATIWGGTSLLELFLFVINKSINELNIQWDYIINLSEKDMPLLSLEELEQQLESASNKSFLSSHGYNTANFLHKQGFYFNFLECENRMWRISTRNSFPLNLRLDGGSDWLSLNSNNFCTLIFDTNLRFTNWKRKQGCRCSAFKPVVDWCGCSPVALKKEDIQKKINLNRCQEKSLFFGRKFDYFVDIEPIAFLEKQVLRFRPEQIPTNLNDSLNSIWINLFSFEAPNDSPFASKIHLINQISSFLFTKINNSSNLFSNDCKFNRLLNLFIFRANMSSKIQNIFSVEIKCGEEEFYLIELLVSQNKINKQEIIEQQQIFTEEGIFSFDVNNEINFEEIFFVYPFIVDLIISNSSFTLNWRWNLIEIKNLNNWTSPSIILNLFGPNNKLIFKQIIKPYDSLNGIQFVEINLKNILNKNSNIKPGTWSASLYFNSTTKLSQIYFPIFPNSSFQLLQLN
ncbi:WSC domain-containing protein [Meloidogyne graminicola]|uniref:protein xylosyltransferase n=1 Tax=Meloidogyne graminicola TaxID=189291 RepID=A0A8S9ZH39_9BILA|nr:WSC domain-containing protein [Meloidogyne graminicola]